jgi:ABC-type transport system involved in cytochrome bd biosynthesis fused ATPase/permease subunit
VLAALDDLARGRTVVTVTHRTAPLALHDRVVVLEDGRARVPAVPR